MFDEYCEKFCPYRYERQQQPKRYCINCSAGDFVGWLGKNYLADNTLISENHKKGRDFLINKLEADPRTNHVISFFEDGIQYIWVIVEKVTPQINVEYARYYAEALRKYDDFICDFMVYSKNDLNHF